MSLKDLALSVVSKFFGELTELGWFDKIADDIHPDRINALCDLVAQAQKGTQLEDLRLVHVIWAGDEGLVSLAAGEVLAYAYGKRLEFSVSENTPVVELFDDEMDTAYGGEPMWGDVADYLTRVKGMK